jgi:hypothetical protein
MPKTKDKSKDKEIKKESDKDEYSELARQIQTEYKVAVDYLSPRWSMWGKRLLMYNNQMRDAEAVGDLLMFTSIQTILASVKKNKMTVVFNPRNEGDVDQAENLTQLALYDYEVMEKDILDYDWSWDTLFFGKGLVLFNYFDRKMMTPIPQVIDPTTFLRDPRAYSVNGDLMGNGRLRFCGWECEMSRAEMEASGLYSEEVMDKMEEKNTFTVIDSNRNLREQAQGYSNGQFPDQLQKDNQNFKILKWFTIFEGKRVYVEVSNKQNLILREPMVLDSLDIPIVERQLFRQPHNWDGMSIPDLTEDKQRANAKLLNLTLNNAMSSLYKRYIYNADLIVNKADLDYSQDSHIGVHGNPNMVIKGIPHVPLANEVTWVMDQIQDRAQRSTGATDTKEGMRESAMTATQTIAMSNSINERYNLMDDHFVWSEKRFWQQWYNLYKKHFMDKIDSKIVRIVSNSATKWRELSKKDLLTKIDPDISIESEMVSEANRVKKFQAITNFLNLAMMSPNTNQLLLLREYGQISGLENEDIDTMIPQSMDEMRANKENEVLNENKVAPVDPMDDDILHLWVHTKAIDNKATQAHLVAHQKNMMVKKAKEQQQAQMQAAMAQEQVQSVNPSQAISQGNTQKTSQPIQPSMPVLRR